MCKAEVFLKEDLRNWEDQFPGRGIAGGEREGGRRFSMCPCRPCVLDNEARGCATYSEN